MEINLEDICHQVCELSREVGQFIRNESKQITVDLVEAKGKNDFVTYVDKTSEKKIVEGLLKILPEAGFIAEENTISIKGAVYNWIIDPLDGTTNFIHSLPCYAISIALAKNNVPVLGVVYEINLNECFYAWEGGNAYLNGKIISVSKAPKLADSLIATGFPYYNYNRLDEYMELFRYLMQTTHGLRRLGSAATDLAYVACGRFEAFYEYNLQPWDIAAGAIIVKQAGGRVTDFSGGNDFVFGKEIIASNHFIFKEFFSAVNKFFTKKKKEKTQFN